MVLITLGFNFVCIIGNLIQATFWNNVVALFNIVSASVLVGVIHISIIEDKKLGRWLSNIYNPNLPDAERYLTYSISAMQNGGASIRREWQEHLNWINQNLLGEPKATKTYTSKELALQGMVGLYTGDKNE